jgi:ATP-dependent DNA ligase
MTRGRQDQDAVALDGEAVVCGEEGVAIFHALHRRGKVRAAILQAFELLELNGDDLRPVMLSARRAWRAPGSHGALSQCTRNSFRNHSI